MDLKLDSRPLLLLQLGEVEYIDSSGLGLLVRLLMRVRNAGGDMKLCGVSTGVHAAFKTTRLDRVLDSYASEDEAIVAFSR